MFLRVNHIIEHSRVQGPGDRFTIWVQGCSIHCQQCNNVDTWNPLSGTNFDLDLLIGKIIESKSNGLTITGGEPLDQFLPVLKLTKKVFPHLDIFLCSGYSYPIIKQKFKEILESIDILCSGPFEFDKICQSQWRGSLNQEIICLSERGKKNLELPTYKREYRINKTTGEILITGFSI